MAGKIVVIGSINMDLVCRTPEIPRPGQTLLGRDFLTIPGGKGANQAVAAAKLGGDVHIVGRVGEDDFGQRLLNGLRHHHVNTDHVTITEGVASGVAMILVNTAGENSIVVAPGANAGLTPADVDAAHDLIRSAAVVMLQLEVPLATVRHTVALCQRLGVYTMLNPAPVPPKGLPRALFGVDLLTPNQIEAEILLGLPPARPTRRPIDTKELASDLLGRGPKAVAITLGSKGAAYLSRDEKIYQVRALKVKVIDTTAAGDAFAGALAVAHAEGKDPHTALRWANTAGALACTTFGAQPSLPARDAVDKAVLA